MGSENITVAGLTEEQEKFRKAFDEARGKFDEAREAYAIAKVNLVNFNNKYGRVLEVLESDKE